MIEWLKCKLGLSATKARVENEPDIEVKRFLIVCLGNIGPEYEMTRHNSGFMVGDAIADEEIGRAHV